MRQMLNFGLTGAIAMMLAPIAAASGTMLAEGASMSPLILPLSLSVLGIFLLIVEGTVLPGFGFAGISGILLLAGGLFLGVRDASVAILDLEEGGIAAILTGVIGSLLGCTGVSVGMIKILPKMPGAKRLIHQEGLETKETPAEAVMREVVGRSGIARTDLRPAGKVRIGTMDFDVTTNDGWINVGEQIVVEAMHDGHLVVRRVV